MIECPECLKVFNGRKCPACGYVPRSSEPVNLRGQQQRISQENEFNQNALDWLYHHRIIKPEMTTSERISASAEYREKLKDSLKLANTQPKAWAYSLKSDYLDGVCLRIVQIKNASAALGEIWQDGKCVRSGS